MYYSFYGLLCIPYELYARLANLFSLQYIILCEVLGIYLAPNIKLNSLQMKDAARNIICNRAQVRFSYNIRI